MKVLNKAKVTLFITFLLVIFFNIKSYGVTGVVTEITVNVREKASTDSKKIMYVTQDDKVDVIEKDGDWYKIKYKNKTGYVYAKYIKVDESKLSSNDENDSDEENIETEKQEDNETEENVIVNLYIKENTQIKIIPSPMSSTIYTSEENENISIIEQIGKWSFITNNKISGWIETEKLLEENAIDNENDEDETEKENDDTDNETKVEIKNAYIKYSSVNLRKSASTNSKVLAKLKLNNEVQIIEETSSEWTKVKYGDIEGYVSSSLLSTTKVEEKEKEEETTSRSGDTVNRETSKDEEKVEEEKKEETTVSKVSEEKETSDKVTGEDIAEYAQKFLGYKYVYGGTSTSGFDCSGLTYYVYKQFGYTLSRTAAGQAKNGKEVAKSDLQPGDLVIFKNNALTKIGHVGIYIGNNKMIHASEPGVGVIITDIDSKAYKYPQRYVTARRIIY